MGEQGKGVRLARVRVFLVTGPRILGLVGLVNWDLGKLG